MLISDVPFHGMRRGELFQANITKNSSWRKKIGVNGYHTSSMLGVGICSYERSYYSDS